MKEQNWLEEGWLFHNHAWHLLHEIIKLIPDDAESLLDYGAGTGLAAAVIHAVFPDITPHVCDIEENSLMFWNMRELDGTILKSNKLPFEDNSFDVVMTSHVLEHMENQDEIIKELFRVCKKRIIIAVPDGDVHFYDHKTIFSRAVLKDAVFNSLSGEDFNFHSFPVYHPHINNLIAVIDI